MGSISSRAEIVCLIERRLDVIVFLFLIVAWVAIAFGRDTAFLARHSSAREWPWAKSGEPVESPFNRGVNDQIVMHYPDQVLAGRALREGRIATWNPWILGGVPQSSSPLAETLYPISFLVAIFPEHDRPLLNAALHMAIGGLAILALLRAFGLSAAARLFGATAWIFSGWAAAHVGNHPLFATATWLFPGLFGIVRISHGRWRSGVAIVAASSAMTWLAGFIQLAVYVHFAWAIAAADFSLGRRREMGMKGVTRVLLSTAAAVAAGILLSAPALLSAAELRDESRRTSTTVAALEAETFRPKTWIGAVLPSTLGDPMQPTFWRDEPFARILLGEGPEMAAPEITNWVERTVYPGLVVLLFALSGIADIRRRGVRFAIVSAVAGIALSHSETVVAAAARCPGFAVGAPARAVFLVVAVVPILAAFGVDRRLRMAADRDGVRRSGRWVPAALFATSIVLLAIVLYGFLWPQSALERLIVLLKACGIEQRFGIVEPRPIASYIDLVRPGFSALRADLLRIALFVFVAAIAASVARRGRRTIAVAILLFAGVVDSAHYFFSVNRGVPRQRLYESTPGLDFLSRELGTDRIVRVSRDRASAVSDKNFLFPPNLGIHFRIRDAQGYRELVSKHYLDLWDGLPGMLRAAGFSGIAASDADSKVLDLCRVRFLLAAERIESLESRRVYPERSVPDSAADLVIYENPDRLPEALFIEDARVVSDHDARAIMVGGGFDPRRDLLLAEESTKREIEPISAGTTRSTVPAAAHRTVDVVGRTDDSLEVRVGAGSPGYLLLTDSYDPGWRAMRSGSKPRELPVLRADLALRAVAIDGDAQTIRFSFEPRRRTIGFWIAGATIVIGVIVLLRKRSRIGAEDVNVSSPRG